MNSWGEVGEDTNKTEEELQKLVGKKEGIPTKRKKNSKKLVSKKEGIPTKQKKSPNSWYVSREKK